MDPAVRYVLAIAGALIGAWLGASSGALAAAVAGGVLGYLAGDLGVLRTRLRGLEAELINLRRRVMPGAPDNAGGPAAALPPELAPPAARVPRRPAPPSPLVSAVHGYLTGGNTLVRVGVIVLFFGVAFLLRYVAEHSRLSIELRLSGVALGAIGLLVLGWRLRRRRAGYAFALQGGAVGILYLTVFAALRLYALLPPTLAFTVLVLIAALSAVLAVLQDSQGFALLGVPVDAPPGRPGSEECGAAAARRRGRRARAAGLRGLRRRPAAQPRSRPRHPDAARGPARLERGRNVAVDPLVGAGAGHHAGGVAAPASRRLDRGRRADRGCHPQAVLRRSVECRLDRAHHLLPRCRRADAHRGLFFTAAARAGETS